MDAFVFAQGSQGCSRKCESSLCVGKEVTTPFVICRCCCRGIFADDFACSSVWDLSCPPKSFRDFSMADKAQLEPVAFQFSVGTLTGKRVLTSACSFFPLVHPVPGNGSPAAAEVREVLRDPVQRLPRREALRRPRRLLHGARPLRRHPQQYGLHSSLSLSFRKRTTNKARETREETMRKRRR